MKKIYLILFVTSLLAAGSKDDNASTQISHKEQLNSYSKAGAEVSVDETVSQDEYEIFFDLEA